MADLQVLADYLGNEEFYLTFSFSKFRLVSLPFLQAFGFLPLDPCHPGQDAASRCPKPNYQTNCPPDYAENADADAEGSGYRQTQSG